MGDLIDLLLNLQRFEVVKLRLVRLELRQVAVLKGRQPRRRRPLVRPHPGLRTQGIAPSTRVANIRKHCQHLEAKGSKETRHDDWFLHGTLMSSCASTTNVT